MADCLILRQSVFLRGKTMKKQYSLKDMTFRRDMIKRANGRCGACGFHDKKTVNIDHMHPKSLGGDNSIDNLHVLCAWCNNVKKNFIGVDQFWTFQIFPKIDDFGNYDEVQSNRDNFKIACENAKNAEANNLIDLINNKIGQWNVKKRSTIWNKLKKHTSDIVARQVMAAID
jgi:5-methylcytosine-specific restriction endonuclease McrA